MLSKNKKPLIIVGINVSKCCYVIDYDPPEGQGTWGGAMLQINFKKWSEEND